MKRLVAIVGRANVGKSTLFNRLIGRRQAIVEDEPGVTRDRLYGEVEWAGNAFRVVDTGGLTGADDPVSQQAVQQARLAVAEADLLLFMVDGRTGPTAADEEVAELLRRSGKPTLLVVNKLDDPAHDSHLLEFYALGLGEPLGVSALHGRRSGDLLDQVVARLPLPDDAEPDGELARVAIVGRPNVGKSSLFNRLIGSERAVVSELPGTTRDAVEVHWEGEGLRLLFIDTAGLRRRSRVAPGVERYSVLRALRAVEGAHVVLLLIDATAPATRQDQRLGQYAHAQGRGLILVVNKWDLVEKTTETAREYERDLRAQLPFLDYASVIFVSASTGQRVHRLPGLIAEVAASHAARISTGRLNRTLQELLGRHSPAAVKGRLFRLYYATQVAVQPPTFLLFCNEPDLLDATYRRYLERGLREAFGFVGTPVRLVLRRRDDA